MMNYLAGAGAGAGAGVGVDIGAGAGYGAGASADVGVGIGAGAGYGAGVDVAYADAAYAAAAAANAAATTPGGAGAGADAGAGAAGAAGGPGGAGGAGHKAKRTNLDEDHRHAVIAELLRTSVDGVIQKGAFTRVAAMFKTNRHTIASLWKVYVLQKSDGVVSPNLRSKRVGNCGRKRVNLESLTAAIPEIPLKDRTTQRTFAAALGIPRTTFRNNLQRLGLRASKGTRKPRRRGAPTPAKVPSSQQVLNAAQSGTRV
ncbi:unnamed protein product [Laminaria digitata]